MQSILASRSDPTDGGYLWRCTFYKGAEGSYMLHGLELSIYIAASRASRTTGSLWLALSHTVILLPLASYKTISHTK